MSNQKTNKFDSSEIKEFYQSKFRKHGVSPNSLLWKGKGAAHQRFRQFWKEIDFSNSSVLDVGCGFGELGKFLTKRYANVDYTGIDITPEFIREAKKLYPNLNFIEGDYLQTPLEQKYDIVVASGVLNSNVPNNMAYRKSAIKTLFEGSKKVTALNMLGGHPQPKSDIESNVWYADSLEILEYCLSLTRRVVFKSDYHPRDFTLFLYHIKN